MQQVSKHQPVTQFATVRGDRQVAYCEYGDPGGTPVFYFHGTPGSRYEPAHGDRAAKDYGFRILALDRPGIGRSEYVRKRSLLDWPIDVLDIARILGIGRFGVIGVSGGGPYALACCAAIPDRLEFSALMGSWAPVFAEPKLWEEMAPLDRFFGKLSLRAPWAFYLSFSFIGYAAKWLSPQNFLKSIESSMSAPDLQLMSDEELARFFAEDIKEAFQQGVRGPADDAILLYGDWGFRVEEIQAPVQLFHGEQDKFAPYRFALYLDEKLPRSILHSYSEQGHLFLVNLFGEVFERVSTAG